MFLAVSITLVRTRRPLVPLDRAPPGLLLAARGPRLVGGPESREQGVDADGDAHVGSEDRTENTR
jgi:hypothetical protein